MAKPKITIPKDPLAKVDDQLDKDSESCAHPPTRETTNQGCPPFPEYLLDGTETPEEVLRKIFPTTTLARRWWSLLFSAREFVRKDGTRVSQEEPRVIKDILNDVWDRTHGKPAVALPAAAKLPDQADDTAALLERAKESPALRAQTMDQLRKLLVELERIDVEGKKS